MRALVAWLLVGCRAPVEIPGPQATGCFVELGRGEGIEEYVYDVAWSPEGDAIATGGAESLRWYAVDDGLRLLDHVQSDARFNSVVFDGQGRLIAPTGEELRRYRFDGGLVLDASMPLGRGELQRASVTEDGAWMLVCDTDGLLYLVDEAMTLLDRLPVHERCTRVALSEDGQWGLSEGHDGDVVLTDLSGDRIRIADRYPLGGESGEARFYGEGIAYAGSFDAPYDLVQLQIDFQAGELIEVQTVTGHRSGLGAIDVHPDRPVLVTGDHDNTVHLFGVAQDGTLSTVASLPDDGLGVHAARFGPRDQLARTASRRDTVVLYDASACFE